MKLIKGSIGLILVRELPDEQPDVRAAQDLDHGYNLNEIKTGTDSVSISCHLGWIDPIKTKNAPMRHAPVHPKMPMEKTKKRIISQSY
jgi:hypothetical protein